VQQFHSIKYFDLKQKLQLFPFPSVTLLFPYFEASVEQYCLRRLQTVTKANSSRRYRHCKERHTCLSELSAIIRIIQVYNSVLCTSTKHYLGKLLLRTPVFDDGLVKSFEITSRPHNHTTPVASLSPCTLAHSSVHNTRTSNYYSGLAQHFSV